MGVYKCVRCGTLMGEFPVGIIRCPNCSFRVVQKLGSEVVREIPAR